MSKKKILFILSSLFLIQSGWSQKNFPNLESAKNSINYKGNPSNATDRKPLAFSDKGAWFAFGFLEGSNVQAGFSGPFLMTEQNGVWLSPSFVSLELKDENKQEVINWKSSLVSQNSFNSHLEQQFKNDKLEVKQQLVFLSGHSALQKTSITNKSTKSITIFPSYNASLFLDDLQLSNEKNTLKIVSTKSTAVGYVQFLKINPEFEITKQGFKAQTEKLVLKPNETKEIIVSQSFIFPQYSWKTENETIQKTVFTTLLNNTQKEKEKLLADLIAKKKSIYKDQIYSDFAAKLVLTLQNNTRIAAEGLKHGGLFPSYNYEWFHGFWAWDSWKHAVAVANYDTELAKNQMRALFDYQDPNGFIPDCIYRNNLLEENNYRNTKAPLAAWAIWKIYEKTKDADFIKEFYQKLTLYHNWWYKERDHDQDGLCEFGSTDGTVIAAKWESGMDNAVRFDDSKILKNDEKAYSLDQESVDLNSFLFAEKNYLSKMATVLKLNDEAKKWKDESDALKLKIQKQFWDESTGWFYDTTIDGKTLIKAMGCEGYCPIWAEVATAEQAKSAKNNMIDPASLNTFVPLPTLAANHPKFKPDNGYWRGPIWLDQSYFGINGLEKYGYSKEANELAHKLMHNAEGALDKGTTIRENYQPLNGKGLEAFNFSWSASHYLMLLLEDK
ncbi:MGH1-like glycoside hydrolase domain-containing protein [Flavobacterium sharifuzzamanii]|uniref:MGH1-like glycoside hydrolase domain-containing protein n=1 Tax=Flavobacterium sharifuzzamanii TaxID=2211133 RepID=UPI000DAC7538|nr:trehalase family glycosidase [Flavobacterium sharifuzzamanii]KAF2082395.1 trehalase [Flavobacterium sharifuzzamanii]